MKNKIIIVFFLLTGMTTFAQIDMDDSSVQVILTEKGVIVNSENYAA